MGAALVVPWSAFAASALLLAGCVTGSPEQVLHGNGTLDLRRAARVEVGLVRDRGGFTVDEPPSVLVPLGGDLAKADPATVVLGVPGFLAMQLVAMANGALLTTAVEVAQGGSAEAQRTVLFAANLPPLDEEVLALVLQGVSAQAAGRVARVDTKAPARDPAGNPIDPSRWPTMAADGREISVQVRILFQGLQRRTHVGMAEGSDVLALSPPLALVVAVQVLASTVVEEEAKRQQAFVGGISVRYESASRMIGAWSANRAERLRTALAEAHREILREVAARMAGAGR